MNALERHLNLLFVLVNSKRPLTKEELRSRVGGYEPSATEGAFERMFERDKRALREIGILIETVAIDPGFSDVDGYVLDPERFFLTDLNLDGPERAILAEASRVWKDSRLAKIAADAAGRIFENDDQTNEQLGLSLGLPLNQESAIAIFGAVNDGKIVKFDYLTKGEAHPKTRTVEPWQVLLSGGHWYLVGFDHARQEQRTFKLARLKSDVTVTDQPITHFKPLDFDILQVVSYWRQNQDGAGLATVQVARGQAGTLRLQAETVETDDGVDEVENSDVAVTVKPADSWDVLTIRYANEELLARDIATVINHVGSVEPESLRQAVIRIVRATENRHQS